MHAFSPTFCKGPFLYTFSPIFVIRFCVRFHLYFVRVCLYVRFIHILLRSAFTCVFTDVLSPSVSTLFTVVVQFI